jgi:hypothetical protein
MATDQTNSQPLPDRPAKQPIRSRVGGVGMFIVGLAIVCFIAWRGFHLFQVITGPDDGGLERSFVQTDARMLILLFAGAAGAFHIGRQLMAPDAEAVLARDHRKPVVYLRPFEEDTRKFDTLPVGRRTGGKKLKDTSVPASLEPGLAASLKRIGPFVCAGHPGDRLAPLGAARLYIADKGWEQRIDELVRNAAAIVLCPETSESTRWEVMEVARLVDPRRVLLIVPNPAKRPLGYARIRMLMSQTPLPPLPPPADCKATEAFMFDEDRRPQPLSTRLRSGAALRSFVLQVQRLEAQGAPS